MIHRTKSMTLSLGLGLTVLLTLSCLSSAASHTMANITSNSSSSTNRWFLQYYVGCSGWSYTSWRGPFYPSNINNTGLLKYYSHVFDYVEIDSSFYRTANVFTVSNWVKRTPKNFKFTAKFPRVITHDKRLKDVDKELEQFFEAIGPLSNKTFLCW